MGKINNTKLFLDDLRFPVIIDDWVIVRSFEEAIEHVEEHGCPITIAFDHDLGVGKTGFDFAKWLVEKDLDCDGALIPVDFTFSIHSANPIGSRNIKGYLDGYLHHRGARRG